MCSTTRRTMNKKTIKETEIKLYEAMAVPSLTYGSEIWAITKNRKQKLKLRK
jgi:hypothetical protein